MIKIKLLSFLIVSILFVLPIYAQDHYEEVSENEAIVYFLRSSGFTGSATAFNAFIDSKLACKLNNKRYSVHNISEGTHRFAVQAAGKKMKKKTSSIELQIVNGKEYYFQIILKTGFWGSKLVCQEITENSAKQMMKNLKEDKKYY